MMQVIEGQQHGFTAMFVDDSSDPIIPDESVSGPTVTLFDKDRSIIDQRIAVPSTIPGEWQVDITVPFMDLIDNIDLNLHWEMLDDGLNRERLIQTITVMPATENRISDLVSMIKLNGPTTVEFVLPATVRPTDKVFLNAALNNEPIIEDLDLMTDPSVTRTITSTRAVFKLQLDATSAAQKLQPVSLVCTHVDDRRATSRMYQHNLWLTTMQTMVAVSMMEAAIDKAKVNQVIASLQYTTGDYLNYLYRGLQMFNQMPPLVTNIRGTNMQGTLLECWLVCSQLQALYAQTLAEGASAFDFSGQTVNLNVDRTPSLEAAIGRLESAMENQVKPYKKLLAKANILDNDGSIGSQNLAAATARAFGRTGVINSPTTKLRRIGPWVSTATKQYR